MLGITRGISTLIGAGVAGFLIWLATQMGSDTEASYWATYGLIAVAGLTMALSQILGGWTKWGWPRLSAGVFLLGFLPVLVAGGWVLLARQPADFFNTSNWSRDLGIDSVVGDLGELLAVIAFGIGLTFGFCFDTAGPTEEVVVDDDDQARARGAGRRRRARTNRSRRSVTGISTRPSVTTTTSGAARSRSGTATATTEVPRAS